jgi:hypothetical protein
MVICMSGTFLLQVFFLNSFIVNLLCSVYTVRCFLCCVGNVFGNVFQ